MVGSLTLPDTQYLRAGSVSLSSPNHSRLSTCVELNQIFCSLYRCPSCLLGSFCRGSWTAPTLGLFPLATKFPLFCRPEAERRRLPFSQLCLFPGSRGWRWLAGIQSGPLTFTCQVWEESLGKFLPEGMPPSPPASPSRLLHILSTRAWVPGLHGYVSACRSSWDLP